MDFKIKPYDHQMNVIMKANSLNSQGFFWEMGTGKTGGTINCLRCNYAVAKRLRRTLIVSPVVTLFNWKEEFELHSKVNQKDILVLDCSGRKRINMLRKFLMNKETMALDKDGVVIINYEALQNKEIFDMLMEWQAEIIVGDEIHYIKNPKAKRAKQMVALGDKAEIKYALSGTPILNCISDIFMQYRFLDGGNLFGKNFYSFRARYMEDENAAWSGKQGHFAKWGPRDGMYQELHDKMYSISTRVTKEECLNDLPPLIKMKRVVELSAQQAKMYKQMKTEFITWLQARGEEPKAVTATIALTKALRLVQIVTGFVTTEDGEVLPIEGPNPRLDETKRLLEEITPNHKVILWCSYKYNYKQLGNLCTDLGIEHEYLTGQMDTGQKREAMDRFRKEKNVRVIIANRRAGGIGINLVEASYSIVYSRNFSFGEERQSEARNHRGGSQIHAKVVKIDLVAKNTIDELLMLALQGKQKLSDMIIDRALKGEI